MEFKASAKYVRTSPRKVRLVARAVRPLSVSDALIHLQHMNKRAAEHVYKVIHSALANADQTAQISKEQLIIQHISVDQGPVFKRWQPASRGMAHGIGKFTSHITVTLATKEGTAVKKPIKHKKEKQATQPTELKKTNKPAVVEQHPPVTMKAPAQKPVMRMPTVSQRTTNK